jgi:hypothetical protein
MEAFETCFLRSKLEVCRLTCALHKLCRYLQLITELGMAKVDFSLVCCEPSSDGNEIGLKL